MQSGSIRLRVTPSQLQNQAQEVTKQIQTMENTFTELEQLIEKTSFYWIGEAGDLHRKKYQEGKETIDEMLRRWKEHPKDLLQMAGVYSETEQKLEELASVLPDDVIV